MNNTTDALRRGKPYIILLVCVAAMAFAHSPPAAKTQVEPKAEVMP